MTRTRARINIAGHSRRRKPSAPVIILRTQVVNTSKKMLQELSPALERADMAVANEGETTIVLVNKVTNRITMVTHAESLTVESVTEDEEAVMEAAMIVMTDVTTTIATKEGVIINETTMADRRRMERSLTHYNRLLIATHKPHQMVLPLNKKARQQLEAAQQATARPCPQTLL